MDNLFNILRDSIIGFSDATASCQTTSNVFSNSKCYRNKHGEIPYICEKLLKIQSEDNPVLMKKLGEEVRNFKQAVWESCNNPQYSSTGLTAKFSQNEKLLVFLKATIETLLAEANPHERLFDVGYHSRPVETREMERKKN